VTLKAKSKQTNYQTQHSKRLTTVACATKKSLENVLSHVQTADTGFTANVLDSLTTTMITKNSYMTTTQKIGNVPNACLTFCPLS